MMKYLGYLLGVVGVLLLGSSVWGDEEIYLPDRDDMSLVTYLEQQIVDTHRDDRSNKQTALYTAKITEYLDQLNDERMIWILQQVLKYIQLKPLEATTEIADDISIAMQDEQEVLFDVQVILDGLSALNVRSGPSTSTQVIDTLVEGDQVAVIQDAGERYQIDLDGSEGWVSSEYVETIDTAVGDDSDSVVTDVVVKVQPAPADQIIKRIEVSPNDVGSLRVRDGPSSDAEVIGKIDVGGQIDVLDEVFGYFRVDFAGREGWIAVDYVHLADTPAPTHHLSTAVSAPQADTSSSKQQFLDKYRHLVDSKNKELLDLCTKYYDKIDIIAKKYDFPVELIIATWFREHTCKFFNPSNGRGNFQITSHYYPPGDITRADFEAQVIAFIKFSQAKRDYYDAIQTYGPEPVSLSYDEFDLTSIRKQAILYNGIVGELDTNVYANQNFGGVRVGGVDGIVTMFLKMLKYGLER